MIGFALEGGGAKGAYQAGAYHALIKRGIRPSIIAGTSIGSLNAALMAQGDLKKLENLWLNTTTDIFGINSKLIDSIKGKKITKEDIKLGYDNLKTIIKNKGIDTSEYLNILKANIDEDKLRRSKIKFGLITIKVTKGKFEPIELIIDDIPYGKVAEYILASCSLPIFNLKPIIDDNYYIDGGFYNNIPLNLVEKYGCDTIYSIRIKGIGIIRNKLKKETKVIKIEPKENLGSIIVFNKESNTNNMKLGYYDALKVIDNLDGNNYYFKIKNIKYYDNIVKNINSKDLNKLKLKYLSKDNKTLIIKIVEDILSDNNIDRFKIRNIKLCIWLLRRKKIIIKDKLVSNFIYGCKLI